jgi:microcystin-dependent protein
MSSTAVETNPDADGVVGSMLPYAGEVLPSAKWRWAHGAQELSRTEFSLLFARLGESWGPGDGSTTFDLPDMDKRVMAGVDSTGADAAFDNVGDTGGTAAATMPIHTHSGTFLTDSTSVTKDVFSAGAGGFGVDYNVNLSEVTGTVGDAGGSGDNWPPYAAVRFIVKVA